MNWRNFPTPRWTGTPRPLIALAILAVAATQAIVGCDCESKPTEPPVNVPPIGQVLLNVQVDTVSISQSVTYAAVVYDTSGAVIGFTPSWISGNTAIFTVSSGGQVTGRSSGTTSLIATLGGQSDTAFITVIPGPGWILQQTPVSDNLYGVFFQPDGRRGWAVGDNGRIIHTADAGVNWVIQQSNTVVSLRSVWFTSADVGWAVGDVGTVRMTVDGGETWAIHQTGQAIEDLNDVHFASPDTGWAVGATGVIVATFDGGQNWFRRNPTTFTLRSVSFAGSLDGWAVGDNGTIVGTHNAGNSWFVMTPSVTSQTLNSVWRRSEARAWAGGLVGAFPFTSTGPDSTEWNLGSADGANNQVYGVSFPTNLIGWVAGLSSGGAAIVLRTDDGGSTWQAQTSGSNFQLNDVFFLDVGRGWVVGHNGVVIHTGTGGL